MRLKIALLAGAALALTNVASAQENEADIETTGNNSTVNALQDGDRNQIGSGNPDRPFSVSGDDNVVNLEQQGADNIIGRWSARVTGDENTMRILQDGRENDATDVLQRGDNNLLVIEQLGNGNRTRFAQQSGNGNTARITQDGNDNGRSSFLSTNGSNAGINGTAFDAVLGSGSNEDANGQLRQSGDDNDARIIQDGRENGFFVLQPGDENFARIDQDGNYNHTFIQQEGSLNTARVEQFGDSNLAAINQPGTNNTVRVTQSN